MTLVEFLTRRYDELEVAAHRAADESAAEWEHGMAYGARQIQTVEKFGNPGYLEHIPVTHDSEGLSDSVSEHAGDHIALHDPAYVLADITAKRVLLAAVQRQIDDDSPDAWIVASEAIPRALAAPFATHPDFLPEWSIL